MPGNDQVGSTAQLGAAVRHQFRRFNFHVHRTRAVLNTKIENFELFFNAAVEFAVVLMAAAGGQNRAGGVTFEKLRDGAGAGHGVRQVVQTELQEVLAGLGFSPRLLEKTRYIG